MIKAPLAAGSHANHALSRSTPLTGVVTGVGISLVMWAMILSVVFAVR